MHRVATGEVGLSVGVVGANVGKTKSQIRPGIPFSMATHHMRHIRAHIAIGLAWTRQYKASAIRIGRVVKAHAIETRFIEGQRREISVDLIAYHQAIRTTAIAVGGDHQAVKKTSIGISPSRPNRSFAQYATLGRRLGLRPVVNQPTSPQ